MFRNMLQRAFEGPCETLVSLKPPVVQIPMVQGSVNPKSYSYIFFS